MVGGGILFARSTSGSRPTSRWCRAADPIAITMTKTLRDVHEAASWSTASGRPERLLMASSARKSNQKKLCPGRRFGRPDEFTE